MTDSNIFSNIPMRIEEEVFETLLESGAVRIERIVSRGQTSPEGFWYDQDTNEWVIVLRGRARLLLEGNQTPIEIEAGDYLQIPAHRKHRVDWTDPGEDTVWLAVYY